jgi:hypothetical protein
MYRCLSLVEGYSANEAIETDEKVTARRPDAPARFVASLQKRKTAIWMGKVCKFFHLT